MKLPMHSQRFLQCARPGFHNMLTTTIVNPSKVFKLVANASSRPVGRPTRASERWGLRGWVLALLIAMSVGLARAATADVITISTPLDSTMVQTSESNFGDMVADAVQAAAPGADFAICPASEIDPVVIDAGKVDSGRIAGALRAQSDPADTVEVMTLTGSQVRDALAHSVSRAPGSFEGFLQVSGITVRYDAAKHGAERIVSATVTKTGQALDLHATYKVAMTHYLADGALGYFEIWASASAIDTHTAMTDAVVRYATNNQPISYHVEGRVSKV
jgi:2',3'-cyclic-nucleotide 2'-phosphodiesterase (5'-nucleotidase family)